jgi:hypothetical protein
MVFAWCSFLSTTGSSQYRFMFLCWQGNIVGLSRKGTNGDRVFRDRCSIYPTIVRYPELYRDSLVEDAIWVDNGAIHGVN